MTLSDIEDYNLTSIAVLDCNMHSQITVRNVTLAKAVLSQGLLKIWTGHSHWFFLNPKPFEIAQQKLQHFYNYERNEFSPNFKGVAQKVDLPRPLEVSEGFGRKCKSEAPRAFNFQSCFVSLEWALDSEIQCWIGPWWGSASNQGRLKRHLEPWNFVQSGFL